MVELKFIDAEGTERIVEAKVGDTVMRAAKANQIPGIVARCGGTLACATCHCYVDDQSSFEPISDYEEEMLEGTFAERLPNSRLSCQLDVTAASDGVVIRTPDGQG